MQRPKRGAIAGPAHVSRPKLLLDTICSVVLVLQYMRPRSSTLTDHELELMHIIWERGEATVRDVYEELLRRRRVADHISKTTIACPDTFGTVTVA